MKKQAAVLAAALALMVTGAQAADLGKVDLGGTYWYAGKQQTATHEQVLQNIHELNEMVDKDLGLTKTGLATVYKQVCEQYPVTEMKDSSGKPMMDEESGKVLLKQSFGGGMTGMALGKVGTKVVNMIANKFGMTSQEVLAFYKDMPEYEKGTKKPEGKAATLYKATTAAYKARQVQTHLMTALPKAADTVNKAIDQVNANTKSIDANKHLIDANAKSIADHQKAISVNAAAIADNQKAIVGNTEAIAGVAREVKAVDARVTAIDKRVDKVGALSGALAGLKPMQYDPLAPTQFMGAISTYEGAQGYALGVVHYAKEDVMLHGGVAYDGDSDVMGNIGVTVKVGSSADKAGVPARYQAGPISSIYVMQLENEQMRQDNVALQQRVAELERMVRALAAR